MHRSKSIVCQFGLVILLLIISAIPCLSQKNASGQVNGVNPANVRRIVDRVLQDRHSTLWSVETNTQDLLSSYEEFRSHLLLYRARFRFHLQGTSIIVTMEDLQSPGKGTWSRSLIPADGAQAKLIAQVVDQLNAANREFTSASGGSVSEAISSVAENRTTGSYPPRSMLVQRAKTLVSDPIPSRCSEGMCAVRRDGLWGFIDYDGNLALDFLYRSSTPPYFSNGACVVSAADENRRQLPGYMYIDKNAKVLFDNRVFQSARPFADGFARVQLTDKTGRHIPAVLDLQGHTVVLPNGVADGDFHEGLIAAYGGPTGAHKVGFRDANMRWAVQPVYEEVQPFSGGVAWVEQLTAGGVSKWGAVNKEGRTVIPFMFSKKPDLFSEGLAVVSCSDGKQGYVDKTGELVIPCEYRQASRFVHGRAFVLGATGAELIDERGATVADEKRLGLSPAAVGSLTLREDGLYYFMEAHHGVLDEGGNRSVPSIYSEIGLFPGDGDTRGLAWASYPERLEKNVHGVINRRGEFVVIQEMSKF
jgi:hypothetical protein